MVAAGLILLMFVGYGVYTLVKSSAASAPDVVVKQFFEVGGNRDLNGMMSLVDPAKSKEIEKVCKTYFINQGFGLGFTRVLDYELVKNGDTATVTVTVPAQYIRGGNEPYGTTVNVADVTLHVVNSKWVISKVVIKLY